MTRTRCGGRVSNNNTYNSASTRKPNSTYNAAGTKDTYNGTSEEPVVTGAPSGNMRPPKRNNVIYRAP